MIGSIRDEPDEPRPMIATPEPAGMVPAWLVTLNAALATVQAHCARIPVIERKVEELQSTYITRREYDAMGTRVETLWGAYQRLRGAALLLGGINATMALYVAGHVGHLWP